jgi:hypothetical protein
VADVKQECPQAGLADVPIYAGTVERLPDRYRTITSFRA